MANSTNYNYENLDRPYDNSMQRSSNTGGTTADIGMDNTGDAVSGSVGSFSGVGENVSNIDTVTTDNLEDLWIKNFIKSNNYKPKSQGFLIDGTQGYIECMKLYVGGGGIVGGTLDIPDTTSMNAFHVDAQGNTWWGVDTVSGYAAAPAYVLNTGDALFKNVTITGTSTVGGRLATTLGSAININGDLITDVVNTKLNTDSQAILASFDFGTVNYAGAVKAGDLTWDNSGNITGGSGVAIYKGGIVGAKAGTATFTITTAGDATFKGAVTAMSGSIAGLFNVGSITMNGVYGNIYTSNWNPGISGWWIDEDGWAEFNSVTVRGTIYATGGQISGDLVVGGTINANLVTITNLNAGNITSGNIYVGGGGQVGNIIITQSGGLGTGYLRWTGGSRMWEDGSSRVGLNSIGSPMYIYVGSSQRLAIPSSGQTTITDGVNSAGNLNVSSGNLRVNSGSVWINTFSSPSQKLWVEGAGMFVGNVQTNHLDPRSAASYNLGGASLWWAYVNCIDVTYHSLGFYDDGVTLQDGTKVTDLEAIKYMKPHKTLKTKDGAPLLDKFSLPKEAFVQAKRRDGTLYNRDKKTGYPIIDDDGKKEVRHDADGESGGQLLALALGGIRELCIRIEALEEKDKKIVKPTKVSKNSKLSKNKK